MLKVVLCLVIALSLTNALPVRNRFSEDFDDYAREAAARKRSHFEDLYDSYLRRREPSKSEWVTHISHEPRFQLLFLRITYMRLFGLRLQVDLRIISYHNQSKYTTTETSLVCIRFLFKFFAALIILHEIKRFRSRISVSSTLSFESYTCGKGIFQ